MSPVTHPSRHRSADCWHQTRLQLRAHLQLRLKCTTSLESHPDTCDSFTDHQRVMGGTRTSKPLSSVLRPVTCVHASYTFEIVEFKPLKANLGSSSTFKALNSENKIQAYSRFLRLRTNLCLLRYRGVLKLSPRFYKPYLLGLYLLCSFTIFNWMYCKLTAIK